MNTQELTLRDIVDAFKPKMDGVGVVVQASEKVEVPESESEHAGEESNPFTPAPPSPER